MNEPRANIYPDGRLHLQHGPIDLLITLTGTESDVRTARRAAALRFRSILDELMEEIDALRTPVRQHPMADGLVANRMIEAVSWCGALMTPMAAVAGAVADEILDAITAAAPLRRAIVNNGGDIALHLEPGTEAKVALCDLTGAALGTVRLGAGDRIGGIATSGRGGRSLTTGIADSVTVIAATAAEADAAATSLAGHVDLPGHPAVTRAPASTLQPDSDLADRLVVTAVGALSATERDSALAPALDAAEVLAEIEIIREAVFFLQGTSAHVGNGRRLSGTLIPPGGD